MSADRRETQITRLRTLTIFASAFALAMASLLLTVQAEAAGLERRYTSIANKDCRFAPIGKKAEDAEDQSKTCPGLGGLDVRVQAFGTRVRLAFGRRGRSAPAVVEAWSAGDKIEWHGAIRSGGFKPEIAIVRMLFPKDDGPTVGHQVLAVVRVTEQRTCLMGSIDIGANRDAYELIRTFIDRSTSFECGRDKPVVAGSDTEWARRLLAPVAH